MLERAAYLLGKPPQEVHLVTMHLESRCSATAISKGKSIDNTMGFTLVVLTEEGLQIAHECSQALSGGVI